jgi:hypothetical protein
VAFSQGNIQGAVSNHSAVIDKDSSENVKMYPQFQLHIPTTNLQKNSAADRREANNSALSYGSRPTNQLKLKKDKVMIE